MATVEQERSTEAGRTQTMRAAVVEDFTRPLVLKDVPRPSAGAGEIVVRVETSGLCHTDIHAAHGDWPVKPTPPFIPGHEGVGIVEEVGAGVTEVGVGDRVAMPWLGYACGTCDYCVSGWETLCLEQQNTGYSIDGGFAEYVKANGRYVVKVPPGVDPVDAAPLTCAGVTTYKAVKVAGRVHPTSSPSSASAASVTSRFSTRGSPAAASWPSTSTRRSSSSPESSARRSR